MNFRHFYILVPLLYSAYGNASLTLTENKLDGLVVSVESEMNMTVTENFKFLLNLQSVITDTSRALYEATFQRIYLGRVTIALPSDFRTGGYDVLMQSVNSELPANVVVTPQSLGNSIPYTVQGGRCGSPGHKINLPCNFFMPVFSTVRGEPGKILAKEILKVRYGVYEESGFLKSSSSPYSYFDPIHNITKVTSCTDYDAINGTWVDSQGEECDPSEGDTYCRMKIEDIAADYSIMFRTKFPKVRRVCTSDNHDYVSPTMQNRMCGQSILDVILRHPDFSGSENSPGSSTTDTSPEFVLVQKKNKLSLLLLLELDAGTNLTDKVNVINVHANVSAMIPDILTSGISYFGVAYFKSLKKNGIEVIFFDDKTLVHVNDINVFNLMYFMESNVNNLNRRSSAQTEKALNKTLFKLQSEYDAKMGDVNILVMQTENSVADSQPISAVQTYMHISGVLYGENSSNPWLQPLTSETGGVYYFDESFNPEVVTNTTQLLFQMEDNFVSILQEEVSLQQQAVNETLELDETIGLDTVFTVAILNISEGSVTTTTTSTTAAASTTTSPATTTTGVAISSTTSVPELPDVSLFLPNGSKVTNISQSENVWVFYEGDAVSGQYTITFSNFDSSVYALTNVISKSRPNNSQILLEGWTSATEDIHNLKDVPLAFYVSISLEGNPVSVLSDVFLYLYTSKGLNSGTTIKIQLYDDGNGDPDMTEGDGIYSAYLINTATLRDNNVTLIADIVVQSNQEAKALLEGNIVSSFYSMRDVSLGPFDRENQTDGILLTLDRYINSAFTQSLTGVLNYNAPPSRVVDLETIEVNQNGTKYDNTNILVTLMWTAPGGNLTTDKASKYELRHTYNESSLSDFTLWTLVGESDVKAGSLSPESYGTTQNVTISLPKYTDKTLFFLAIRAIDESNNKGEISPFTSALAMEGVISKNGTDNGGGNGSEAPVVSASFFALFMLVCLIAS